MEEIGLLMQGFAVALQPENIVLMVAGIVLGVLIGVLPGLGGANGIAILLPLTFALPPVSAIILLSCIYWGALFGGAITSILFNIPGEPWSVATTFDGYPMAQQGRAGEALVAAFTSSFVGAFIAVLMITFVAPLVAQFALQFGPPEFFAVMFLSFACFIGLSKGSPFKALAAMMFGFLLAGVGLDGVTGQLRMTFGSMELMRGVDFLVVVIGLFGLSEIFQSIEEGLRFKGQSAKITLRTMLKTWSELPRHWWLFIRSSVIGCWMGITPAGATPASFMSYGMARRMATDKDSFGKGRVEGVIAPETAAHAAGTAALLPMLSLGVPGSPTAAVLLGGLIMWGLQPGPMLFVEQKDFVWGLIASMYIGNIVGLIIVLAAVPWFAMILRVPFSIIAAIILMVCAIGAYTVNSAEFDVVLMLIFGVIGYVMKKLDYPLAPLVLALVLGDRTEESFRQALLISEGSLAVFFSNWLVGGIMVAGLTLMFYPAISALMAKLRPSPA
ncbi:tripartite tricarboxylate transporter permease [Sediminicoccus sp. KRV36]|uniref:tripartite tricarboxylate transporter permease n=1 Tax=Sediminicoccus sp. KRV36 TaxID=3133721 RepID=UPI00200BD916|nr:tripartite tricarboxylate transporter permease [Sediminicoccus rosea]UPY37260.1 tripartite tricarboxylate transporter permease [Sediminicoccus rosea]